MSIFISLRKAFSLLLALPVFCATLVWETFLDYGPLLGKFLFSIVGYMSTTISSKFPSSFEDFLLSFFIGLTSFFFNWFSRLFDPLLEFYFGFFKLVSSCWVIVVDALSLRLPHSIKLLTPKQKVFMPQLRKHAAYPLKKKWLESENFVPAKTDSEVYKSVSEWSKGSSDFHSLKKHMDAYLANPEDYSALSHYKDFKDKIPATAHRIGLNLDFHLPSPHSKSFQRPRVDNLQMYYLLIRDTEPHTHYAFVHFTKFLYYYPNAALEHYLGVCDPVCLAHYMFHPELYNEFYAHHRAQFSSMLRVLRLHSQKNYTHYGYLYKPHNDFVFTFDSYYRYIFEGRFMKHLFGGIYDLPIKRTGTLLFVFFAVIVFFVVSHYAVLDYFFPTSYLVEFELELDLLEEYENSYSPPRFSRSFIYNYVEYDALELRDLLRPKPYHIMFMLNF